jgi:predicted metal-dependent peptidase
MRPNPEITQKMTKARATMIIEAPFFGMLALRLQLVPKEDDWFRQKMGPNFKPTVAVDGRRIFYSETFVEDTPIDILRSAIAHEVGHCIYEHMSRRGAREPKRWNIAGDYVINDMLHDAKFKLGDGWIQPNAAFKGMSTDQIYNLLPPGDDGDGGGSGAHDHCFDGDPDGGGENGNDPDKMELASDWKVATIQAATQAKQQGKLPGSLERFIDEMVNPKVDWREKLWHLACEKARDDFSWARPNRRMIAHGLVLPGMYSERMGVMAVCIDTSGSITQEVLNAFGAEITAIRDHLRPDELVVMYCDAEVNHVDTFRMEDEVTFAMHGGGGTDFRPPFEWLAEQGIEPVSFVYLTDMYGAFPDQAPPFPMIWCATTERVGPFGETVHITI